MPDATHDSRNRGHPGPADAAGDSHLRKLSFLAFWFCLLFFLPNQSYIYVHFTIFILYTDMPEKTKKQMTPVQDGQTMKEDCSRDPSHKTSSRARSSTKPSQSRSLHASYFLNFILRGRNMYTGSISQFCKLHAPNPVAPYILYGHDLYGTAVLRRNRAA